MTPLVELQNVEEVVVLPEWPVKLLDYWVFCLEFLAKMANNGLKIQ